jgi:hypothetical protein
MENGMAKKALGIASLLVVLVGIVNFITFYSESLRLGGDAMSGHQADGRFYLSNHGVPKEVTEEAWRHSLWHSRTVFVTHPLAMLAMVYLAFQFILPAMVYRGARAAIASTERRVREFGPALRSKRCAGRIGKVNFGGPLLRVVIYSRGVWIKPIFMAPIGVPSTQVTGVVERTGWMSKIIEISHSSTQVPSPILLFCGGDSAMAASLRAMVSRGGSI